MKIESFKEVKSRKPSVILLLCSLMAIFFSQNILAGSLTLAWDASTSSGVAGYVVSYGSGSRTYTANIDVGNVTRYQITNLPDGATLYFGVKAYNSGRTAESAYSNEISAVVPTPTPVPTPPTWTKVANEGASFSISGTQIVRFGYGNSWVQKSVSGAGQCTRAFFGSDPAVNQIKSCEVQSSTPGTPPTPVSPPVANFIASPTSGVAPITVNFTDTSTGNITSRSWSFGDGTSSTATNPSHTYATGTYTARLTVTGSGGSSSKTATITVSTAPAPTPSPSPSPSPDTTALSASLVAAYSFEEVSGALVADASGKGNHGTISAATRSAGRFGNGLSFNGTSSHVLVNDSASLDLSSGYTLEAWVNPAAIKSGTILMKEKSGGSVYNLYAYEDADIPVSSFNDGTAYRVTSGVNQLPLNTWSHLVATYDRQNLRLYVNGAQVATRAYTGLIQQSTGALRIGGNSVWGEYFNGVIDEVRIYNRALTSAEIQTDLKTAVVTSNPPKFVVGNTVLESTVDGNPQGTAEAFKATPAKTGVITSLNVYLDGSSTATAIAAAIYSDNAGHPGTRLARGTLSAPRAGATNKVDIPAVMVDSTKPYWVAILGTNGTIKFRDRKGSGAAPMETSASTTLWNLPSTWTTGRVYPDGPMSVYGSGY